MTTNTTGPVHSAINKISIPALPPIVLRSALFRKLKKNEHYAATWISAMAGSGKTTLAASFIGHQKHHCIWYTLDEGDEDPASFFYYLGMVERAKAASPGHSLPFLTPEYLRNAGTFAKRFFESLCARLPRPLFLVFDDYHKLPPDSAFHEIFQSGISAVPPDVHVLVLSRTDPPAHFARMLANNRMRCIDSRALKLDPAESGKVAEIISGKRLPKNLVDEIYHKTEGWAAGLVYMAKKIGDDGFSPGHLHTLKCEDVYAYFASEFFHSMQDSEKAFLKECALFPVLPASLVGTVTGNERAFQTLSTMARHHLFTEAFPGGESVFRFHPLFREFLLKEARATLPRERMTPLQCKAGDAFARCNAFEEAAELYHDAGAMNRLGRLIEEQAAQLIEQGRNKTLEAWIRKFPEEILQHHPWIYYWRGVSRRYTLPAEASGYFEKAFHLFAAAVDRTGAYLAWVGIIGSTLYEWNDFTPLHPWIDWLERRLNREEPFPSPEIEAVVSVTMMSALLVCRPEHPDMMQWVERALALSRENGDRRLRIEAADWAITYYSWAGRFARAEIIKREAGRLLDASETYAHGRLHWKWLDISTCLFYDIPDESTLQQVSEALEMAERTGVSTWQPMLLLCGVFTALILEDFKRAEAFLQCLAPMVDSTRQHGYAIYLHCTALYYFLKGDTARALEHARTAVAVIDKTGYTFPAIVCRFGLSQILISKGAFEAAGHQLSVARRLSRQTRSRVMAFMCLMGECWSAWMQGREKESGERLRELMRFGRENGFKGTIWWWNPEMMSCLCSRALSEDIEVDYCRTLIEAWHLKPVPSACTPGSWPWPLKIRAFDRLVILVNGKPIPASPKAHTRPIELLTALIARGGKGVDVEMLADDLWPEADGDMAQSAFSTTLNRLRKILVQKEVIQLYNGRLSLNPLYCWLDIWSFEEKIDEAAALMAQEDPVRAKFSYEEAVAYYEGPFLSREPQKHWMVPVRERLALKFLKALGVLGGILEAENRYDEAIRLYQQGLEADNLEETFYQRLMRCHEKLGRDADAVKVYLRCKETFHDQLRVSPAAATDEIYERIIARQHSRIDR